MSISRSSLVTAAIFVLCSLVPFALQPAERSSAYAMMPGVILGMYASVIAIGSPHGGSIAPVLIVGSIVNFFFYTVVCYAVLKLYRRSRKKP